MDKFTRSEFFSQARKVVGNYTKDGYTMTKTDCLRAMADWEIRFAKDAVSYSKRLVRLAKLAKKGYACPAYCEEAAAIAESLQRNGGRVAEWLKALYEAENEGVKARNSQSKASPQTPSGTACEADQVQQ